MQVKYFIENLILILLKIILNFFSCWKEGKSYGAKNIEGFPDWNCRRHFKLFIAKCQTAFRCFQYNCKSYWTQNKFKEVIMSFSSLDEILKLCSTNSKQEDWNAMVRKSTHRRDPIGKRSEALSRQRNRESLRRNIVESQKNGLGMDTDHLIQYNPKLADVSHPTRVAYAKFMTTKIKKEIKFKDECGFENEQERTRGATAFSKFKSNAGILKKAEIVKAEISEAPPSSPVPEVSPAPSPTPVAEEKDFRSRTPIEEDPLEDIASSRRSSRADTPIPTEKSMSVESAKSVESDESKTKSPKKSPEPAKSPEPLTVPKSPEPPATPSKNPAHSQKDDVKDVPAQRKSSSANLTVPGTSQPPLSPSYSSTGEKGKSKITGKTISGWL